MELRQPHPRSLSPRALNVVGWITFVLALAIFLAIAWNITTRMPLVTLDAKVATWLHTHGFPLLTHFMVIVTQVHSVAGVSVMSVIFGIVLWRLKERYWLATLALGVGGGMLLNVLLKDAYERARPHFDDPMVMLDSYSFPSGHTAGAVLFYGVLAAFLVSRYYSRRIRIAIVSAAIFAVLLVALSRMYLGAHYLSDVVAAVCSSTAWLVLCLNTMHDVVRRRMAEAKRP